MKNFARRQQNILSDPAEFEGGTSETIDVKMNSGRGGVRRWNVGLIQFAAVKAFYKREKWDKWCYMLGLAVKR